MALIFANIFGWLVAHKRLVLYIAIGIVVLFAGLYIRSCWNGHKAKLNEQQIQRAQEAIAKQDREEMQKVLIEAEVQEKAIDANVANAEAEKQKAITEAKKRAAQMTNEELAAELERLASE